jgi:23S rRNA pseudouridine2605 synthase
MTGERIAKVMARAGLCSRREAERWIEDGRVSVGGTILKSPACVLDGTEKVLVDGKPLPGKEPTRLFRFHKPRGLVTTHSDPQGRTTIFDRLPADLPRLISVGRLDLASEGLILLTNDGELARRLTLPRSGWVRRYRVRVFGRADPPRLAALAKGITLDGVHYGAIEARVDRQQGDNAWLTVSITEGKNREIRKVFEHLGWPVSRLIRVAFGPFQLGHLAIGALDEIKGKVLAEQMGAAWKHRPGKAKTDAHRRRPS